MAEAEPPVAQSLESAHAALAPDTDRRLVDRYLEVRRFSESLCADLEREDLVAQSMPDASPLKWHLAHTAWFFEVFVLEEFVNGYRPYRPTYRHLFNSYYNAVGSRHERPLRGVLTRPTVDEVYAYRAAIDEAVLQLLGESRDESNELFEIVELGLHHEQQHQELMLTDLKHLFSLNPLDPTLRAPLPPAKNEPGGDDGSGTGWVSFPEGIYAVGHDAAAARKSTDTSASRLRVDDLHSDDFHSHDFRSDDFHFDDFHFDNEGPRHRVLLGGFALAERPVTNAEYLSFIEDGGYERSDLWLDHGWATVQNEQWRHPLYWRERDGHYREFTLAGEREWAADEPVSHVSFVEADAFARWAGARLATEFEWEVACSELPIEGNFAESGRFHPSAHAGHSGQLNQAFGDVWEWTQSGYSAYPGYRPTSGALGEYNGKFMCNQLVLRGGSCASSRSHLRATYRNFFYPKDRWQFSGIRLAKECV